MNYKEIVEHLVSIRDDYQTTHKHYKQHQLINPALAELAKMSEARMNALNDAIRCVRDHEELSK